MKLLLIFAFVIGLAIGCEPADTEFKPAAAHFTYNGHDYIKFGGTQTGYVHDPDCHCQKDDRK